MLFEGNLVLAARLCQNVELSRFLVAYAHATYVCNSPRQVETGKSLEECRKQVFMLDSKGLVCKSRLHELQHHKINFAHEEGEKMYQTC